MSTPKILAHNASKGRMSFPEWGFLLTVFAVAALVIFTRRPDAFTNPQFYFEDGIFYGNAHEWGVLKALTTPYRGYFVTVQRLCEWFAQLFPLRFGPLVVISCAVVFQVQPAVLICSSRFAHVLPDRRLRILVALLYLAVPNSWTTISSLAHTHYHLAALACFVLLAQPAGRLFWRIFDVLVLLLSGLSGPFAIFLTPIAAAAWWRDRSRWRLAHVLILALTAATQLLTIVLAGTGTQGARPALGASISGFFSVWTKQVVYGAFVGQRGLEWIFNAGKTIWVEPSVLITFGSIALAILVLAAIRGPFELRMVQFMAASIFVTALAWPPPQAMTITYWESISYPGAGNRYFLLSIFVLGISCAWLLRERKAALQVVGALALLGLTIGIALDWKQPALRDYDFARYVRKYEDAKPGEKVQIPYPPNWGLTLTKKE